MVLEFHKPSNQPLHPDALRRVGEHRRLGLLPRDAVLHVRLTRSREDVVRLLIVLVLLLVLPRIAPAQSERPQSKAGKRPATDYRGTDKQPLVIKRVPSMKTEEEVEREEKQYTEESTISRSVAHALRDISVDSRINLGLTVALILVAGGQLLLFWRQLRLIDESLKPAKVAAEAARTSADLAREEFVSSHRPQLIVRRVQARFRPAINEHGINLVIANIGDSIATNITGNINIRVIPTSQQADFERESMPQYGGAEIDIGALINRPPRNNPNLNARERTFVFFGSDEINADSMSRVERHESLLYFYGYITYSDANQVRRDCGFFRNYNPNSGKFQARDDDPDYEWH